MFWDFGSLYHEAFRRPECRHVAAAAHRVGDAGALVFVTKVTPSEIDIKVSSTSSFNISALGHLKWRCTVGAKRFHCAEVLFQSKTYELPDGTVVTVGSKRFR